MIGDGALLAGAMLVSSSSGIINGSSFWSSLGGVKRRRFSLGDMSLFSVHGGQPEPAAGASWLFAVAERLAALAADIGWVLSYLHWVACLVVAARDGKTILYVQFAWKSATNVTSRWRTAKYRRRSLKCRDENRHNEHMKCVASCANEQRTVSVLDPRGAWAAWRWYTAATPPSSAPSAVRAESSPASSSCGLVGSLRRFRAWCRVAVLKVWTISRRRRPKCCVPGCWRRRLRCRPLVESRTDVMPGYVVVLEIR
jgi:hypothetical protein